MRGGNNEPDCLIGQGPSSSSADETVPRRRGERKTIEPYQGGFWQQAHHAFTAVSPTGSRPPPTIRGSGYAGIMGSYYPQRPKSAFIAAAAPKTTPSARP